MLEIVMLSDQTEQKPAKSVIQKALTLLNASTCLRLYRPSASPAILHLTDERVVDPFRACIPSNTDDRSISGCF